MKSVLVGVLLLVGCASTTKYAYEEMDSCPASMSAQEHESGVVRCRALCSSYARDFAEYDADCRCRCMPGAGGAGGYRAAPQQRGTSPYSGSQTMYSPGVVTQ